MMKSEGMFPNEIPVCRNLLVPLAASLHSDLIMKSQRAI